MDREIERQQLRARFPVEPLLQLTRLTHGQLAERVGTQRGAVVDAVRRGVSIWTADSWATRCGFHPGNVWPDWLAGENRAA